MPPEQSLIALGREFGMIPEAPQVRIDWNDPAQRALGAHEALLLNLMQRASPALDERCKGGLDFAVAADIKDDELLPHGQSRSLQL